jgi:hypothetical protein
MTVSRGSRGHATKPPPIPTAIELRAFLGWSATSHREPSENYSSPESIHLHAARMEIVRFKIRAEKIDIGW